MKPILEKPPNRYIGPCDWYTWYIYIVVSVSLIIEPVFQTIPNKMIQQNCIHTQLSERMRIVPILPNQEPAILLDISPFHHQFLGGIPNQRELVAKKVPWFHQKQMAQAPRIHQWMFAASGKGYQKHGTKTVMYIIYVYIIYWSIHVLPIDYICYHLKTLHPFEKKTNPGSKSSTSNMSG